MHDLCIFLFFFVQKSFLTKNYHLTAEINLTIPGPLYTCLVIFAVRIFVLLCLNPKIVDCLLISEKLKPGTNFKMEL